MNGRAWTQEQIEILMNRYPDTPTANLAAELGRAPHQVYAKANALGLKKSKTYLDSPHACRLRRGDNVGAAFRFQKGHVPANKGLRRPGWHAGRMRETQFKKGQRGKRWVPIGTEIFNTDGYLVRKVREDLRGAQNWKSVHTIIWEDRYGPVPACYAVKFIDGNKHNVVIGNLCLVSRQDLAAMNRMWTRYPKELARAIQLHGAVVRRINRRRRDEEPHHRPT